VSTYRPNNARAGAEVTKRQPTDRVVTPEVVRHLRDGGASRDLVDFAQRHVNSHADGKVRK
jgi:hypothetical protein